MSLSKEEIDNKLRSAGSDRERIDLMNRFSYSISKADHSLSRSLYEDALVESMALNYDKGIALALANKAFDLSRTCQYSESLAHLEEAEAILKALPESEREHLKLVINGLGTIYLDMGSYSRAALYYREALNLIEDSADLEFHGKIYINLSTIHARLKQWEKALDYADRAYRALKESIFYDSLTIALNNMSNIHNSMGNYKVALSLMDKADEIARKHSLISLHPLVLQGYGEIYINQEEYEKALDHYLRCYKIASENELLYDEVSSLEQLGILSLKIGAHESACSYLEQALALAQENNLNMHLNNIHKELYQLFKEQGDPERALYHHEEYHQLEKHNYSLDMERNLRNMEADSLAKSNSRIKIISAIGREITSTLDMGAVLNRVYENVNSLMPASLFGIADYEKKKGRINYKMFLENGNPIPIKYSSIDNRDSLAAYAIRERKDILINDFYNEFHHYLENYEKSSFGIDQDNYAKSLILTPLYVGDEITGIITAQSYYKNAYTLSDMDSLKALASYAAIALRNAHQAEQIKLKNEKLNRLAITDALTGIFNRREFEKRLSKLWREPPQHNPHFSILLIDADNFKKINDTYGHLAGDECLKSLSSILEKTVSDSLGCLARYGGEEFIILLNMSGNQAMEVADELCRKVREQIFSYRELEIPLTISIGVSAVKASGLDPERTPEQLISHADRALYCSKSGGRDRFTYIPFPLSS